MVILLVVGWVAWLLGTDTGHRRILDRVTRAAREAGGELTVESFSLDLRRGRIELRTIAVGVPGGPPLLRADALVVVADLGSLTGPNILVREIRLERPVIDLTAPRPAFHGEDAAPGTSRTITVERFVIANGSLRSTPLPPATAPYLTAVSASGIEVEGSFRDEKVVATIRVADIAVDRPGVPAVHLSASTGAEASMAGDFTLRDLAVSADGLALAAGATGRMKPALEVQGNLTADIDAPRLAPDLATGGRVHLAARAPSRDRRAMPPSTLWTSAWTTCGASSPTSTSIASACEASPPTCAAGSSSQRAGSRSPPPVRTQRSSGAARCWPPPSTSSLPRTSMPDRMGSG